jgi:hypothetical protein
MRCRQKVYDALSVRTYVVGPTTSTDFPIMDAAYPTWIPSWGNAGYVAEIDTSQSGSASLVYSTYLPGGPGNGITVHAGEVYVTGTTSATSFPTTSTAFQKSLSGTHDAFVAVLNPTFAPAAQLVYATYLSGNGGADGASIAVDGSGNAYVTGTAWQNFPTTSGAFRTRDPGGGNVFVAKINPSQSGSASLVYSTYLGSKYASQGQGIAVDSSGNAYVTGIARQGFPVTANAIQSSSGSAYRAAFVTTLNASGSALLFSTYLSGTLSGEQSVGWGIALDGLGDSYVTGWASADFPTTSNAFQRMSGSAIVAIISPVVTASAAPAVSIASAANSLSLASNAGSIDPVLTSRDGAAINPDRGLALLLARGGAASAVPSVPDGDSRGPTVSALVAPGVLGIGPTSATPPPTPQAAWPPSPATVARDWLFADLVSGGLADSLAEDALLAPPA